MKVALVLTQDRGGPVDLAVGLALELAGRAHGPEIAVMAPEPVTSAGDIVHLLRPIHVQRISDCQGGMELRRALAAFRPDIVHAQDRRAGLFCATLARGRPPVVQTYHGLPEEAAGVWVQEGPLAGRRPPPRWAARLAADALVGRMVDATVSPSHAMAGFLTGYLKLPKNKVRVIHNGVKPPPARPPSGPARRFVSVGAFIPRKALPLLVDAFAETTGGRPDLRLNLVGDGPDRARVEQRVAARGLEDKVEVVGYRRDVPEQLARADAFVMASLMENLPLALLEAMGAGLACIASRVGGIPEILDDSVGLVVPPGDVIALARAMGSLADEPSLAPTLGRAAAAAVRRRFTMATCADAHVTLWTELADRSR